MMPPYVSLHDHMTETRDFTSQHLLKGEAPNHPAHADLNLFYLNYFNPNQKLFACVGHHVKVQCKYTIALVSLYTAGHMGGDTVTPGFSLKFKNTVYNYSLLYLFH
ncbi:hypothetical protein VIGAN_02075300 [Vigna angularis var. angularis]|uniref:Uncharacterized protein n=1 Tax=Vigna angularis var. angularis TaxID=157739 RepID=A0A0S3RBW9_PHAAN|nr:hypothetical protein VIGAN_02075300 [Vigna angularis var. angularis]